MSTDLQPGQLIGGRYRVTRRLGSGGYGVVYRAVQVSTGQDVAVKLLAPPRGARPERVERERARFAREVEVIARLRHPNIVRLVDSGTLDGGEHFMVLEYVDGLNLDELIEETGPLAPEDALHVMSQVLDALGYAHRTGIVHRDLKPANIMVSRGGLRLNAVVLDFGVAGILAHARGADYKALTAAGTSVGTPAYMAPEQLRGEAPTPATDLYAWGLVMLKALTGRRPIPGRTAAEVMAVHIAPYPIAIPEEIVQPALRRLLELATAKDPLQRLASAEEAHTLLRGVGPVAAFGIAGDYPTEDHAVTATSDMDHPEDPTSTRAASASTAAPPRHQLLWLATGLAVLLVAIVVVGILIVRGSRAPGGHKAGDGATRPQRNLEDECARGELVVCVAGARSLAADGQPERAGQLLQQACQRGSIDACADMGASPPGNPARRGDSTQSDPQTDCDAGVGEACTALARSLAARSSGGEHADEITALLVRGCRGRDAEACADLPPETWSKPFAAGVDLRLVASAYRQRCDQGKPMACVGWGLMTQQTGSDVLPPERILGLFVRACDQGLARGCRAAGETHVAGGAAGSAGLAAQLFERGCDGGDGRSCLLLGARYEAGEGVARSGVEAGHAYQRGCDASDARSCIALAMLLRSAEWEDLPRATAAFERACDLGEDDGCQRFALAVYSGSGVAADPARAGLLLEAVCQRGIASACVSLGLQLEEGDGVPYDPARAAQLYEKACVAGVAVDGCSFLGRLLMVGSGVARDVERGRVVLQRGCDGGDVLACTMLGDALSEGAPAEQARATETYERACDLKGASACRIAGYRVVGGQGVAADDGRALELFARACDLDDALGCSMMGDMLVDGRGLARNPAGSVAAHSRACELGDGLACVRAGRGLESAGGADADVRAATLYERACTQKFARGCTRLGRLLVMGRGLPHDAERAIQILDPTCTDGDAEACYYAGLARIDEQGRPRNVDAVDRLLGMACSGRQEDACLLLGRLYLTGLGHPQDTVRGRELIAEACARGSREACRMLDNE